MFTVTVADIDLVDISLGGELVDHQPPAVWGEVRMRGPSRQLRCYRVISGSVGPHEVDAIIRTVCRLVCQPPT